MRLTNEELLTINRTMLGLGAPVEIDGYGYNKVDFEYMVTYKKHTHINTQQALRIAKALFKYRHTQLIKYATRIEETIDEIKSNIDKEKENDSIIRVVSYDFSEVCLAWKYNSTISTRLNQIDRTKFRWGRNSSGWVLHVKWSNIELIYPIFQGIMDISHIAELKRKALQEALESLSIPGEYVANVVRLDDTIDTLVLSIKSHPAIESLLLSVPNITYIKSSNMWVFFIEQSKLVYDLLSSSNGNIDLKELKPWADIVSNWDKVYSPKDFSRISLKFKPYQFQLDDVKSMLDHRKIINANDMGCGKTHESVRVGESLPMKKLVICPPTLRLNWVSEIKIVNPEANICVLYDNSDFKVEDWTIIGYNSVYKHLNDLEKEQIQCIFIDEAHYCQAVNNNGKPDSQRSYSVLRLTAMAGWVYPITGTPKTNRNKNLFNLLRMIGHPLTKGEYSFFEFGKTFCGGVNTGYGWDFSGNTNDEELHKSIKDYMVRHLKSEVLPDLKKQRIALPIKVNLDEYNSLIDEYLHNRSNKEAEQLARLMKARQVLAVQKVNDSIEFAKSIISEDEKVVIVSCFTEVIKRLERTFKGNCVKIVGGMNDKAKEKAKTEFQEGDSQVILLNIQAGGVGITLTSAHKMIINDLPWTTGELVQVEDRICRSGQTAEFSTIYYLSAVGADIEENMIDLLTCKSNSINNVVDGGQGEFVNFRELVNKKRNSILDTTTEDNQSTPVKSDSELSEMTNTELEDYAHKRGIVFKTYEHQGIHRMRLIMQIRKSSSI